MAKILPGRSGADSQGDRYQTALGAVGIALFSRKLPMVT
jgi:hypothetical protein